MNLGSYELFMRLIPMSQVQQYLATVLTRRAIFDGAQRPQVQPLVADRGLSGALAPQGRLGTILLPIADGAE
jgi:hypothetical protein